MKMLIHDYAGHPFQIQLSRELAKRGHTVTHAFAGGLLTPRGKLVRTDNDPETFSIVQVPMHKDYKKDKYSFFKRRSYELKYGHSLVKTIQEVRPDLVLSGNTPSEPQRIVQKYCKKRGIAFYCWIQDFYGIAVDKLLRQKIPFLGGIPGAYYKNLDARTLRESRGVVVITEDFKPIVEKLGVAGERIFPVPNWAPLDEIPLVDKKNTWSEKQGLDATYNIIYSGTLAMKHNPALLLALAERFHRQKEVRVVVISEGPGSDWLKEKKDCGMVDNLLLYPFQDFADMPSILGCADTLVAVLEKSAGIFSVPSKVLTYLCAQKPVLMAVPGENLAARIVVDERAGKVSEPEDEKTFVENAWQIYQNEQERVAMGKQARAYAESNFEISGIADRFERFLK